MKILIVTSMYPPYVKGGGEISTSLLAENLVKIGHEVTVLTLDYSPKEEKLNGVDLKRVNYPNIYWSYDSAKTSKYIKLLWHFNESFNFLQSKKLLKFLAEIDFDIIHTNVIEDFSPSFWRFLRRTKRPIVHTLRSYYLMCYRGNMFKTGKSCSLRCTECKVLTFYKRKETQNVDAVVGISKDILNRHTADGYFKRARKFVIGNSFETDNPVQQKRLSQIKNIGFIGKLDSHKGVEFLLKRIIELNDVRLVMAGFGPLEGLVNEYVSNYPNKITFLGRVDPSIFYERIDALIVPSLWNEPFGRIVIEAYAYSVPVLATNRGGLPELIRIGKTGYVFDPFKEGDFEIQLNNLFNAYDHLSENCRKESLEYKNEAIAQKYVKVYQELID